MRTLFSVILFITLGSGVGYGLFSWHNQQAKEAIAQVSNPHPTATPIAVLYSSSLSGLRFTPPNQSLVLEQPIPGFSSEVSPTQFSFYRTKGSSLQQTGFTLYSLTATPTLLATQAGRLKRSLLVGWHRDTSQVATTFSDQLVRTHYLNTGDLVAMDLYEVSVGSSYLLAINLSTSTGETISQAEAENLLNVLTNSLSGSTSTPSPSPMSYSQTVSPLLLSPTP